MPQKTSPWIEGKYGWNFGESGWNTGMDENLVKFSFLFDRNIDGIVSSLPVAVNGKAYFLTTDNRVYYVVDGIYSSCSVPKWFILTDRVSGNEYVFNGSSLNQVSSPSEVEAELQSLQNQIDGLGSAAQEDVSYFTAQTDLANQVTPGSNLVGYLNSTLTTRLQKLRFPEEFPSLAAWASSGGNLGIVGGTYAVTEQLTFPFGTILNTFGKVTFDASAVTVDTNFPNFSVAFVGGISLTALPKVTTATDGLFTLTFASAHGLVAGDLFALWNPTDSSYSPGHRPEYHEGEFCRVARVVSTTQVVLESPLCATYVAANMDVYKLQPGSFTINGSVKIVGSETLNTLRCFRGWQLADSDLTGLEAISPMGPAAVELRQCYNITGDITAIQRRSTGLGVDYGLSIVGCQDLELRGYFVGSRHGITTGSYGLPGDVVNRNIQMSGTVKTTNQGGVPALNTHGNTEYFSFSGFVYGGASMCGDFTKISGIVFGQANGVCVEFAELRGHNHDLSEAVMRTTGNPGAVSRGVVDLGGNTQPSLAATRGGMLNFKGMTIYAPISTRGIVCRQRVCTADDIRIDVRDVAVNQLSGGTNVSLLIDKVSGSDFAVLMKEGYIDNTNSLLSIANVTEVKGARLSGSVDITTNTGSPTATAAVTYPAGFFAGIQPKVITGIGTAIVGTKGVIHAAVSQSATGFTATVATADNTNFSSAVTIRFSWQAESIY